MRSAVCGIVRSMDVGRRGLDSIGMEPMGLDSIGMEPMGIDSIESNR